MSAPGETRTRSRTLKRRAALDQLSYGGEELRTRKRKWSARIAVCAGDNSRSGPRIRDLGVDRRDAAAVPRSVRDAARFGPTWSNSSTIGSALRNRRTGTAQEVADVSEVRHARTRTASPARPLSMRRHSPPRSYGVAVAQTPRSRDLGIEACRRRRRAAEMLATFSPTWSNSRTTDRPFAASAGGTGERCGAASLRRTTGDDERAARENSAKHDRHHHCQPRRLKHP